MKKTPTPVQFLVMITDPLDTKRPAAWHLRVVDVVDLEDGTKPLLTNDRTLNMEQAKAEGFDVPEIASHFNAEAAVAQVVAVAALEAERENSQRLGERGGLFAAALKGIIQRHAADGEAIKLLMETVAAQDKAAAEAVKVADVK